MKVKEIYDYIDSFAPYGSQFSWDNSGLTAGGFDEEVTGAVVCLDATVAAAKYAEENGCSLIVCHHPSIFSPARAVLTGGAVYEAARRGLTTLSAHTNWDMADGGVNDTLAGILGLENVEKLFAEGEPMMRMGDIPETSPEDFAAVVSKKLGARVRRTVGGGKIKRVAVCGGAGGEYADIAREAGCDCLVTGEAKHHHMLRAVELGLTMVVAGHYETENPSMAVFTDKLKKGFPEVRFLLFNEPPAV